MIASPPTESDAVPRVLIGTSTYPGNAAAMRRQEQAARSLLTLRRAEVVNV